jgi:LPXTG-motif cell wall-anchored protein
MRQLALLAAVYLLVAALVLPASPFAADDVKAPASQDQPQAGTPPDGQAQPPEQAAQPPRPQPAPPQPAAASAQPAQAAPPQAPAPTASPPASDTPPAKAARKARPKAHAASPGSVTIKDFSYGPAAVTVTAGDSVTWTNNGPTRHSATAKNGSFDTGLLTKGKSASHTFTQAGDVAYVCSLHAFMHGTVHVVAASSGNSGSTGSGSSNGSAAAPSSGSTSSSGSGSSSAAATGSGPALPRTGTDAGALALLGALMLGFGAAMRRRSASA